MMNIEILIIFIPLPLFDLGVASNPTESNSILYHILRCLHGKDVK